MGYPRIMSTDLSDLTCKTQNIIPILGNLDGSVLVPLGIW